MSHTEVVRTPLGEVEIGRVEGDRAPVLFFPGGHSRADSDCGWDLYAGLGHPIVSFSRPGYGRTRVGDLTAAEFVPAVEAVCSTLGLVDIAAVVGVSFGGLQAICTSRSERLGVHRLILHSAAPSTLPYPDSRGQQWAGPIVFGPRVERATWAAVSRLVNTDGGLKRMWGALSKLPIEQWWPTVSEHDRDLARTLFGSMRSGRGFAQDLRQAGHATSGYRRWLLEQVPCPTMITASPHDGGVDFAHADDLAAVIPGAELITLESPSHLFWLGPEAVAARTAVRDFLAD